MGLVSPGIDGMDEYGRTQGLLLLVNHSPFPFFHLRNVEAQHLSIGVLIHGRTSITQQITEEDDRYLGLYE